MPAAFHLLLTILELLLMYTAEFIFSGYVNFFFKDTVGYANSYCITLSEKKTIILVI